MKYLPGIIHESLQKPIYYQSNIEFIITLIDEGKRLHDLINASDYDLYSSSFELEIGDIMKVRLFRYKLDQRPWIYIEEILRRGEIIKIELESILNWAFIQQNTKSGCFTDVSKIIERDEKIIEIISSSFC